MSILIKGINVHRGKCWECPCYGEYGDCNVLKKDIMDVGNECPIVELSDYGDFCSTIEEKSKVERGEQ